MPAYRSALLATLVLAAAATPALARPGGSGWGGPGWGGPGWGGPGMVAPSPPSRAVDRSGEGNVEVNRFVGGNPAALGQGTITVAPLPADSAEGAESDGAGPDAELPGFEAAVLDRLAARGYQTATALGSAAQLVEVRVLRAVAQPAEAARKPVSGEMTMGVSNHGSMMGMALNVDLTKPLPALLSTRLEARIRDRASGAVLWEGRAETRTREGDDRWAGQKLATHLAAALFDDFPGTSGETRFVK